MTVKTLSDSIDGRPGNSSKPLRRAGTTMASSFISLEKRIVFDGAAVAHADATFHSDPTHALYQRAEHAAFGPTATEPRFVPSDDRSASVDGMMARLASSFTPAPAKSVSHEIVFIDSSVPDIAAFMKGISPGAEVVMLDAGKDGVDQIAAALAGRTNISAIHIISHGSEANLELGTADLNALSMRTTYAADLAVIKNALAPDADILVYGCDFAKGADGDAAAHELAALTQANVAASTNLTGSADQGGDFILEDRIGAIHTATIDPTDYEGVLASAPVTVFADKGTGLYKPNLEFLTYANSSLATTGLVNGATATYATSDGGQVTLTFSNVVYPNNASVFKPTAIASYGKFIQGYNSSVSTTDALGDQFSGTASFTATFSAVDKNGVSYNPNIAFIDAETTEKSGESYTVTTNGGAFQNVETVGATGYQLNGVGTKAITLQGTTGTGVPVLVTTGATSLNITSVIGGGAQFFEFALVKPSLNLDSSGSSQAGTGNYQTTFTEKGSAVAVAHTDTTVVEPGVTNAVSATIVLSNAQAGDALTIGTLPASITGAIDTSVAGKVTITLSGSSSLANYQSAIEAIKFSNSSGDPSTADRTLAVSFNDGALNSNTTTSTIHVVAVNDAPVETAPATLTTNKDTVATVAGLSVADVDANGGNETVTLSAAHGTLSLASATGLTFSSGTGSNDTSMTFTGTLAAIDNAIGTVKYKPTTAYFGSDTLSFSTNDNGNTGSGGPMTATKSTAVTVANVDPSRSGTLPSKTYADGTKNLSIATASAFSDSLGLTLSYSATGLPPGLAIDATTGLISGTLDHDASLKAPIATGSGATLDGRYSVVVTADDGQGGRTTQSFTFDATNQAPVVTARTANQSAADGQTITPIQAAAAFTDPNAGDVLTYTATGLPSGLSIDAATGAISGTIAVTASRTSPFAVVVTATDEKAAASSESFNFAVANVPPTATQPLPNTTIADGTTGVSIVTASGFTNPLGLNVYSATNLPSGLTINATTGIISGTLDHDASYNAPTKTGAAATLDGTYVATVTVVDNQGGSAFQHVTIDATNQAPVIARQTPNQHDFDGNAAALALAQVFTDPNSGDILTYSAAGLPTGLSIDPNTGRITGTIDKSASSLAPTTVIGSGTFHVSVTTTDEKGATTTETFDWLVDNVAPTATPALPDVAVHDGYTVSFPTAGGFIDPLGLPLTYSATGLPAGLTIDSHTGIISGTVDPNASTAQPNGSYPIQITVSDGQGGTAVSPFTIVSTNAAIVGMTPDQHGLDGQTIASLDTTTAFVNPAGDTIMYGQSGLPRGLAIDPNTGAITGTIDKAASTTGPYNVTITSTDETSGVTTSENFVWTVDTIVPVATPPLPNQAVNDSQTSIVIPTVSGFTNPLGLAYTYAATGLSGLNLTIDRNTGVISGTVDHDASKTMGGVYTIAVTADDGRGNQATNIFSIVSSNQAPIVSQATAAITAVKGTSVDVDASRAFADPNIGDTLTYTVSGLPTGLVIADPTKGIISGTVDLAQAAGLYTATVVATDDKGLSTSETIAVTITNPAGVLPPDVIPFPPVVAPDGQVVAPIDVPSHFSDPNGFPLTFSVAGLPKGLTFDASTGLITGTIDHDASKIMPIGGYPVVIVADDGEGGVTSTILAITSTNQAPTLVTPTSTQNGIVGSPFGVDASKAFVDPNTGDTIVYAAANLPTGLAIDPNSGIIAGTIDKSVPPGSYSVIVTATDEKGLATPETFSIAVSASVPVVAATSPIVVQDGLAIAPIDIAGKVTDPNGFPLMLSVAGLPKGLTFDPSTGFITGTIDHDASLAMPVGGYPITITADDGRGGKTSASFALVSQNTAPQIVAVTKDRVVVAGTAARINTVRAFTDINTGDILSYQASNLPNGLAIDPVTALITGTVAPNAAPGVYVVTVTATDDKGASTPEHFDITVSAPPPSVVSFMPIVVSDGVTIMPIDIASHFITSNGRSPALTVTGLPNGLTFDPATGLVTGAIDHDASAFMPVGGFTVIATADDGQGGVTSTVLTIISTNQAPALVAQTPAQTGVVGSLVGVDASKAFIDPNPGDTIVYAATNLPTGLTIDPATGMIAGTIDKHVAPASYPVIVTATDDKGLATLETFSITVVAAPPVVVSTSPIVVQDGLAIAAIDIAGKVTDPNGFPVTLTVAGLPKGLTFDPSTGLITGTIDHDASLAMPVGGYAVTVIADDGQGGVTSTILTIISTNQAPALVAQTPAQTGVVGSLVGVDASKAFIDPNPGDTIVYAATNLPTGLTIDSATGMIAGTIDKHVAPGSYPVIVSATDDKRLATLETFAITVVAAPPVVVSTSPIVVQDGLAIAAIDIAGKVTDPNGFPVTLTVAGLPKGLTFDPSTGLITGTIDHDASLAMPVGGYAVTVIADDGQGGVTSKVLTIISTNQAPALVAQTPAQTGVVGSLVAVDASKAFIDPNKGDMVTYAASGLPEGLSIDPTTGQIAGKMNPSRSGPYTVTVTATDDKGAATSEQFAITPSVPPQILVLSQNPALADNGLIAQDPTLASPSAVIDDPLVARGVVSSTRVNQTDPFVPFDVTGSTPVGTTAVAKDKLGGLSPFTANGIVLETVQAISGLAPLASLAVDRVVVQTVDGVSALGGLATIGSTRNMVRDAAVSNITPLRGIEFAGDYAAREDIGAKTTDFLGASLSTASVGPEAGLESGQHEQISVETLIRENVIFIAMKLPRDESGDAQVASYKITRSDGEPLPFWLEQSRRGLVFGKLSSARHLIDLKIIATLKNGRTLVRSVVIDSASGQIKPATGAIRR